MSGIDILPGLRTYSPWDAARANALGPAVLYGKPEDEAREAEIAAARSLQESASSREAEATYESICRALDRLDALDAS